MPCLGEVFKQMDNRGLIALCEHYCEEHGERIVLEEAQQRRESGREIHGFVHFGEDLTENSQGELQIPLLFGQVNGDRLVYAHADCLNAGKIVAECLDDQDLCYKWDRKAGSPILLLADESVTGISDEEEDDPSDMSEMYQAIPAPQYPVAAYDRIASNPLRLLNLAKVRRLQVRSRLIHGTIQKPRVGDYVKLGFFVSDAVAPLAREEFGEMIQMIQLESMWVEVTGVVGQYPECVYRGELMNIPVFIDPAVLRIGSPVTFTPDHVYPIQTSYPSQVRR